MRARAVSLSVLLWLLSVTVAHAQNLPSAKPEEVGLSSERLNRALAAVKADVDKGALPGAVLLVARHGKVVMFDAVGVLDPATKAPMTKDAIFRIYSMSKPITSVAAMMLFEEGKLSLADPVSKYLSQMRDLKVGVQKPDPSGGTPTLELVPAAREMTIQDLLRHSAGLTYGAKGDNLVKAMWAEANVSGGRPSNAELIDRIAKLPLLFQPGTTWEYSVATDVLGRVVEVVSDRSLYQFEKERILDPLGMKDTSFYVLDKVKQSRVAEPFPNNRVLGSGNEMNDPRVEGKSEGGGGGMVGTTMDYARFSQMLLNGGTLNGKRLLGPKTVAYMASDHLGTRIKPGPNYLPGPGFGFGLGFAVRTATGEAPFGGSAGEFNWSGAAGTTFWIDPKEDMFVVFMIQDPKQGRHYRALLKDMIYAAVDKPAAK
jgi:CubicO group peptidase (beta-lactamase class C family)